MSAAIASGPTVVGAPLPREGLPPGRAVALVMRPAGATAAALLAIAAVAAADYATGVELPFTILYLVPIAFATWFADRRVGAGISVAAVIGLTCSLVHEGLSTYQVTWNVVGSGSLFVAATWMVDRVRTVIEGERTMRRMATEQLRHAERLNVIGTLAAGVAHELGTPLNVIGGCAELLAEEHADVRIHRRTEMILSQVSKVSVIVRRLLDFGGRGAKTHASRLGLDEVASNAVELFRSTVQKRGSAIAFEPGPAVHVKGNAAELEQVFSNLILNALQAASSRVRVTTGVIRRADATVAFGAVEDDGCGIPTELQQRIFDPFFTTKDVGDGTGLGLSVSYGIVRDHHGWIEVVSEPGHGSRFLVILPLAA